MPASLCCGGDKGQAASRMGVLGILPPANPLCFAWEGSP